MEKIEITYNDVLGNELSVICRTLSSCIVTDITKKDGYDINKNNYHLLTDNEKYITGLFKIISNMDTCLFSIESSCLFMRRFYGKEYYKKHKINVIDYSLYHYDVLCYKISTLKDLYFKIINHLYELNLIEKKCNWKNIEKCKSEINNPFLFSLLMDNFQYLNTIDKRRNKSAHEGIMEHKAFEDISPYVTFTMYADQMPAHISQDLIITRGSLLDWKLQESRKKLFKEAEACRYNAFVFTRCILCSLSNKFASMLDNDIKSKYSEAIAEAFRVILKRDCINNAHPNECPNSPNYVCSL